MAVKIRLARGGEKKSPHYRLVIADVRAPRDGSFIEKVGTYNPLAKKTEQQKVSLKEDRIKLWLTRGAIPSDRVAKLITESGIELPAHLSRKNEQRKKAQTIKPSK